MGCKFGEKYFPLPQSQHCVEHSYKPESPPGLTDLGLDKKWMFLSQEHLLGGPWMVERRQT